MTDCGNNLKGCVITSGTGFIGLEAVLRTGCGLALVMCNVMSKVSNFNIGRIIATTTGFVRFPAYLGAGFCLCLMLNLVMSQRLYNFISGVIASGTGVIFFPAFFNASSRLTIVMNLVVIQRQSILFIELPAITGIGCVSLLYSPLSPVRQVHTCVFCVQTI